MEIETQMAAWLTRSPLNLDKLLESLRFKLARTLIQEIEHTRTHMGKNGCVATVI